MKLANFYKLGLFALFLFAYINIYGQSDSVIKINPSLYVITGLGGNITAKITEKGVVLVDAGTSYDAGMRLKKIIAGITDKPITHLILTHYHYDHSYGLAAFFLGVTIISHANVKNALLGEEKNIQTDILINIPEKIKKAKKDMAMTRTSETKQKAILDSTIQAETAKLEEQKKIKIVYPDKFYDKEYTLISGLDTIVITHSGNAHTNGDSWILLPHDNVVVLGDMLFTNCYPYIDERVGADTKNWAEVLNVLAAGNRELYIPGHGRIAKAEDLTRFSNYLSDLRLVVEKAIKDGKTSEEAKKTINLTAYQDFGFGFFREQNIEAVYNELTRK